MIFERINVGIKFPPLILGREIKSVPWVSETSKKRMEIKVGSVRCIAATAEESTIETIGEAIPMTRIYRLTN
jgi:hypothetical protein